MIPNNQTQEERARELAVELYVELIDCMNGAPKHAYKSGNEQCHEEMHIADILRSYGTERYNECYKDGKRQGEIPF